MHSFHLLVLFPVAALATVNGHCSGTATGTYKTSGICISTATCNSYGGSYITGGCPNDANDIKCCLVGLDDSESTNPCGQYSYCDWTTQVCSGSFKAGYCPGGTNYKCCKL